MAYSILGLVILALEGQAMHLPDTSGWKTLLTDRRGNSAAVNPASVKADENRRSFQMILRKLGSSDIVIVDAVADCDAATVEVKLGYVFKNGAVSAEPRDLPNPEGPESVPEIVAYVCHSQPDRENP